MIGRARAIVARHRRAIVVAALVVAGYCVIVEVWLPRQDEVTRRLDAVMVLSSGVRDNGALDVSGEQRLRHGIDIAKGQGIPLYVSRVALGGARVVTSDSGQRVITGSRGLVRWTILDGVAASTHDEAARLERALPHASIAVVTSRLHTRRACATFEHAGFTVTCVSSGPDWPLWKAPYFVLYESAALAEYRLRGWM
jgi:hypothetical protein